MLDIRARMCDRVFAVEVYIFNCSQQVVSYPEVAYGSNNRCTMHMGPALWGPKHF